MKRIVISGLSAALVLTAPIQATADADGLVGGIVGGIIGGAIVNEANRNRQTTTTRRVVPRSTVSSATRAANRETQTALNYFGFNAGPADGVIGRGTRAAIAGYQAHLGYPATGDLGPYERDFLVTSYQRALAGGATTAQLIATNPQGAKGLLLTFRDQALGLPAAAPAPAAPVAPQGTVEATAPMEPAASEPPAPQATAAAPAGSALPNFLAATTAPAASLASHCNEVSLMTSTNGGFVTLATMTDPRIALGEQFCLARTYVVAEGERLAASVQGFSAQEIAAQCEGLGRAMRDHLVALSLTRPPEVARSVSAFAVGSGIAPAQLAGTAKVCLSVGYRTDNMEVALASALLLTSLGEASYAELVGHHLSHGFGVPERRDLALGWYEMSFEAAAAGGPSVVAPGQPERLQLLRQAVRGAVGQDGGAPVPASAEPAPLLPSFDVAD